MLPAVATEGIVRLQAMLRAHSFLWHYLWVAPNALLLVLGAVGWRRSLQKQFPAFFSFALLGSVGQLVLYSADILPSVSATTFWRVDWANLLVEGILKFALVAEIFALTFDAFSSVAKVGKISIRGFGVVLVFASAAAAAYAPGDSRIGIISGAHLLEQTIFLIETGLLVFIFAFASYFRLRMPVQVFGIALGLAVSACVHLATWAYIANVAPSNETRYLLDFLNMAVYHLCVLIWFYYLLVPHKVVTKSAVPLPEHNLEVWNRELERLLHL